MVLTVHLNRIITVLILWLIFTCVKAETSTFIYLITLLHLLRHLEHLTDTIIQSHLQIVQQQRRLVVLFQHHYKHLVMSAKITKELQYISMSSEDLCAV